MIEPKLAEVFRSLSQAALEIAEVCDRDITEFAGVWHGIARNARVLQVSKSLDLEDVKSFLGSIRWLFGYRPGSFVETYIPRDDFDEQVLENKRFNALKERVYNAAADVQDMLKIDPTSY